MTITLASGVLSYTTPDGTTGAINLANVTTDAGIVGENYSAGAPTANLMIVEPPESTPYYRVRLRMDDWRWFDIFLGTITNKPTWTNDESGMNQCVSDIADAMVV